MLDDEAATLSYGSQFAACLKVGLIVYLHGDLGAGKTTFARGVLRGLGYTGKVKSPTYTLVETYEFNNEVNKEVNQAVSKAVNQAVSKAVSQEVIQAKISSNKLNLDFLDFKKTNFTVHHFDLYRFIDEEEWEAAGFREYFNTISIGVIEWPEKAQNVLPLADIDVRLSILNTSRSIQLSANTPLGEQCLTNF